MTYRDITIPAYMVEWLREKLNKMKEIYDDEGRRDWFEGDDIAISIAYELDDLLNTYGVKE